jgi:hypothetical protein
MPQATNDALIRRVLASGDLHVDSAAGTVTYRGARSSVGQDGYARILVGNRKRVMAHRVVWLSAHPNTPSDMEINHRNGRRWDNRLANLEAVTPKHNVHHAWGHGYAAVASSAEEMDGNSVDPAWFERVMALAALGDVTPEQVQALKSEAPEQLPKPYVVIRHVRG